MKQQELYTSLFGRTSRDPGNAAFLQDVCNKHPYFAAGHFFRFKETGPGHSGYAAVAAKTALHFNNPIWLNFQLHHRQLYKQPAPVISMADKKLSNPAIPLQVSETLLTRKEVPAATDPAEKTATSSPEPLLFEPLHTTDYFASQGIKLSEEVQQGDKLGKQLKSFTEWLKTMKKVHGDKLPDQSIAVDIAVQKMAENSNKEQEVITESMAEVFHQQGKNRKAREVYEKLSLLNPSKSAYFAAKIEFLKEN